jgi:biopolymer transport protein ExbB
LRRAARATLIVLLVASPLAAQARKEAPGSPHDSAPGAPAAEDVRPRETIFSLLLKGRWIMIPMAVCSLVLVTFAIERAISLRRARVGSMDILEAVLAALPSRARATREQAAHALEACDASNSLVGRVLRAGVEKIHRDEAHAEQALEEAAAREAHLLKRKCRPFNVIAALAPLLGLLGTISGMITCFEQATIADTASRVATLTRGIYEALVATATGLTIAIIALILYYYYLGKADRAVDRIDEAATRFLDHHYGLPMAARPRSQAAAQAHPPHHPVEAGQGIEGGASQGGPLLEAAP